MKIRKVYQSDVVKVSNLVRGLSHYYLSEDKRELPDWLQSTLSDSEFIARINDPAYHNYLAEIDDEIVGYLSLKDGFHLYHLFVSPTFHKQGIAKALWQHGVKTLSIEHCSVRSSLFAVPVYVKLGFRISGEIGYKDGVGFQPMAYGGSS